MTFKPSRHSSKVSLKDIYLYLIFSFFANVNCSLFLNITLIFYHYLVCFEVAFETHLSIIWIWEHAIRLFETLIIDHMLKVWKKSVLFCFKQRRNVLTTSVYGPAFTRSTRMRISLLCLCGLLMANQMMIRSD